MEITLELGKHLEVVLRWVLILIALYMMGRALAYCHDHQNDECEQ